MKNSQQLQEAVTMSWIKEANKIGEYADTHKGFRIYREKKAQVIDNSTNDRISIDIIPGWLIAVNKSGIRLEDSNMEQLYYKIEFEYMKEYFDKKDKKYANI